jgi:ribosomal protein L11 methyltransferase
VPVDGEAAEAVCELFERYGGGAVVEVLVAGPTSGENLPIAQTVVRTYIDPHDVDSRAKLEAGLWHLGRLYPIPDASVRVLAEANWAEAWKSHYSPQRIGRSFLIVPSWIDPDPEPGDLVIRLDPGMAFGTGLHPTTRLCLAALERHVDSDSGVLDVGTGSGILAIGAALAGSPEVAALDINPEAVRTAIANAEMNGVDVRFRTGELHEAALGRYRVVVANLLSSTVIDLADELAEHTAPGGILIASGILDDQAHEVSAALEERAFAEESRSTSGDWMALEYRMTGEGK